MAQVSPLDSMYGLQLIADQKDGGTFDRRVELFEVRSGPPGHVLVRIPYEAGSEEIAYRVIPEAALALPTIFLFDTAAERDRWIGRVHTTWAALPDNAGLTVVPFGAQLN